MVYTEVAEEKEGAMQTGVAIQKDAIKKLYEGLSLKRAVIKQVIEAHNEVLKYGLETGNERVIVIDSKTGNIEADETGTPDRVKWYCNLTKRQKLITVHNHPNSSTFSYIDVYSFGINKQTLCMGVQGHNGNAYSLIKTDDTQQFNHTVNSLGALFDIVNINPAYKDKTQLEKGEIFVTLVANYMKWEFLRGR